MTLSSKTKVIIKNKLRFQCNSSHTENIRADCSTAVFELVRYMYVFQSSILEHHLYVSRKMNKDKDKNVTATIFTVKYKQKSDKFLPGLYQGKQTPPPRSHSGVLTQSISHHCSSTCLISSCFFAAT